jgi:hypothetical protein
MTMVSPLKKRRRPPPLQRKKLQPPKNQRRGLETANRSLLKQRLFPRKQLRKEPASLTKPQPRVVKVGRRKR